MQTELQVWSKSKMPVLSGSAGTLGRPRCSRPLGISEVPHTSSLPASGRTKLQWKSQPPVAQRRSCPAAFPRPRPEGKGVKVLLCFSKQDPQPFCAPVSSQLQEVREGFMYFLLNIYSDTVLDPGELAENKTDIVLRETCPSILWCLCFPSCSMEAIIVPTSWRCCED